jgi:vesicle-fusing ATPase
MPIDCLHMTTLEMTHSRTERKIEELVAAMKPSIPKIVDYTYEHRARLIKPLVGYDAAAFALTFVPAAGEGLSNGRTLKDDQYTYHHLRRDVYGLCEATSVEVDSRYTVPSAHLTLGRFINPNDFMQPDGTQNMEKIITKIEEINEWLRQEYWPETGDSAIKDGGEWIVGEEKGLNCRKGTLWYGGGETVQLGKGF